MPTVELDEDSVINSFSEQISDEDSGAKLEVEFGGGKRKVSVRPVYSFERDILDRLIEPKTDKSRRGASIPIKGEWIHGWLELNGEDYINNIWRNYQFFLKYIELATEDIANISTHKRAPGTYNSMYRFILLLEDLQVLERFKRVEVPNSEYESNVPKQMRKRTFVRVLNSYEDEKDKWNNPYGSLYGEGEDIEIEEVDDEEMLTGFQGEGDSEEESEDTTEEDDTQEPSLSGFTEEEEDSEQEISSIEEFDQQIELFDLVRESFPEAMQRTFNESPLDEPINEPEDFAIGQIAVYGAWVVGDATEGDSALQLLVTVSLSGASTSPGFVPSGVQEHLGDVMKENNPFSNTFPDYFITSVYDDGFTTKLRDLLRKEQDNMEYYDLIAQQMREL